MPDSAAPALLQGDVRRLTLRLAAPSLGATLATGISNLADALLAARCDSASACALSVLFPLLSLIQTIGFTLGMGAGSFVSRSIGRSQAQEASRVASTALLFAVLLGGALSAAGLLLPQPLCRLLGAPPEAMDACLRYARCVLLACPALCLSLVLSSLLRAQGHALPNLIAFSLGSALGVGLGALLTKLGWGALGLGVGLIAREGLTLALLIFFTIRRRGVRLSPRLITLKPWVFPAVMRSGLPTLLRQGLTSVGSALLSRISAGFGADVLSGMGVAVRAGALVSSAVIGFGQGFAPVCGANFGAGRLDRVRQAYRFTMKTALLALAAVGALVFFACPWLLALFGAEPEAAAFAVRALRTQSLAFIAMGAVTLMSMLTQAMGQTVRASLVSCSRQGLFFIPLLLLLPRLFGLAGLILCQSASDVLSLGFSWLLTREWANHPPPQGDAFGREFVDKRQGRRYNRP